MGIFKPINPKLDATNSIVASLVFDAELHEGFGGTTELVNSAVGTFLGTPNPSWIRNTYGNQLLFDGANSYITFPDSSPLDITGTEITLEALVYPTTLGVNQQIFAKVQQDGSHPSPYFMYDLQDDASGNSAMWLTTTGNTSGIRTTGPAMTLNTYNHIVGTYKNGVGGTVYKNGVAGTTNASVSGTISTQATKLYIGSNGQFQEVWNGRIVYCRIWSRQLSSTEVTQLYQNFWRVILQIQTNNHQFVSVGDGMSASERIR